MCLLLWFSELIHSTFSYSICNGHIPWNQNTMTDLIHWYFGPTKKLSLPGYSTFFSHFQNISTTTGKMMETLLTQHQSDHTHNLINSERYAKTIFVEVSAKDAHIFCHHLCAYCNLINSNPHPQKESYKKNQVPGQFLYKGAYKILWTRLTSGISYSLATLCSIRFTIQMGTKK